MADEDGVSCTIEGLDDLSKQLLDVGPKLARKAIRLAAKRAAEVIRAAIQANVESEGLVLTGFLDQHIVYNVKVNSDGSGVFVAIGPQAKAGYFRGGVRSGGSITFAKQSAHMADMAMRFAEFGTAHQPATPVMRPAFDDNKEEALQIFIDEVWNALQDMQEK